MGNIITSFIKPEVCNALKIPLEEDQATAKSNMHRKCGEVWMSGFLDKSYGMMRHVRSGNILHIFPSGTKNMGDRGSKKAYTGPRTGIYLPTKFGCDQSIVVGCRSRNDRQTSRQTDKQNGMTIRLTLCERDEI